MCDSQYKYRMGDVRSLPVDKDSSLDKEPNQMNGLNQMIYDKTCPKCTKFFKLRCKFCEKDYCSRCIVMEIHNCSKIQDKIKSELSKLNVTPISSSKIIKI